MVIGFLLSLFLIVLIVSVQRIPLFEVAENYNIFLIHFLR